MSDMGMKIENDWPSKFKDMLGERYKTSAASFMPSQFSNEIQSIIGSALTDAVNNGKCERLRNLDEGAKFSDIMNGNPVLFARVAELNKKYGLLHDHYSLIHDVRKQAAKAETWTGWKLVFFRALTALTIAVIVLGTGCVAKKFDIPLPMFSKVVQQF